jgi:hypothetical protein
LINTFGTMRNPFKRFYSWFYAHPDDAIKVRIEQQLQAAAFVNAYRPGVATKLLVLHRAGLEVEGLARLMTLRMVLLTPENEAAARHALATGNVDLLPTGAEIFDVNADYFHVLRLTHARGSFGGLYYLPVEFNGNVHKLNTVWVHPLPDILSPEWSAKEILDYVA